MEDTGKRLSEADSRREICAEILAFVSYKDIRARIASSNWPIKAFHQQQAVCLFSFLFIERDYVLGKQSNVPNLSQIIFPLKICPLFIAIADFQPS